MNKSTFTAVLLALSQPCFAGSSDAFVAEVGNWKVIKTVDSFSGEFECVGHYKHNIRTYLRKDNLTMLTTGQYTLEDVTIRYGEEPPRRTRKATDLETRFGVVTLKGKEFSELMKHSRVRTRVLLFRSSTDEDVNLTGIQDAVKIMMNGCKL